MSLVALFNREAGWLATEQRIFTSVDLQKTFDCLTLADELCCLIAEQHTINEEAKREGFAAGLLQGAAEARDAGQRAMAEALIELEGRYASAEKQRRHQVSRLALDVVRKIAAGVAPADWLHAQACVAAGDLLDRSHLVLRVHSSRLCDVRALWQRRDSSPIRDVLGDDEVDVDACILETPRGSVDVALDTQLQLVEQLLGDVS